MKRKGAISLCLCVRVTEELRNVRKEGAVRRAIRQFDGNGCLQRERTETQNRFCVEPGILVIEMNRERLAVRNRDKLRDLCLRTSQGLWQTHLFRSNKTREQAVLRPHLCRFDGTESSHSRSLGHKISQMDTKSNTRGYEIKRYEYRNS